MAMLLLELEWFGTQGRTCMFNNYLNQPPNTSQLALDGALLVPKRGGTVVPKALGVMIEVGCVMLAWSLPFRPSWAGLRG